MHTPVGIALGSNLGDRTAEIEAGFAFLARLAANGQMRRSTLIETAPVDCPPGSGAFINAVAEIQIDPQAIPPEELLSRLQSFEVERGRRRRHGRHTPRPLDLDILYYGELKLSLPHLILPHPRLARRRFVLEPLAQLHPDLILPGQTLTIRELWKDGAGPGLGLSFGMSPQENLRNVEQLAYHLWEREGRPPGRAEANWLKAERLLSDEFFLEQELETEEAEGGIVPGVDGNLPK